MRQIRILYRDELLERAKLKQTKLIEIADFATAFPQMQSDDIVIFFCSLLHEYKVLKNRNGITPKTGKLDSPEGENELLSLLVEY